MPKKFFIGVDEAGYGPNLGPLVVAASLWSAPEDWTEAQFSAALGKDFATRAWRADCTHVPLGDSKKLYSTSGGLTTLEAGLLAMFEQLRLRPDNVHELLQYVAQPWLEELSSVAWYERAHAHCVPCAVQERIELERLGQIAARSLGRHDLQLLDLQAAVVCESRFNREVLASGSKGELLSRTTLDLVVALLEQCSGATEVFCDRQGGRKNYLPNLLAAMPDQWFCETAVSQARSSYRSSGKSRLEIHFSVGGDSFPPTALASMLAKYLRERLMGLLNEFWRERLPELQPTAGYPVDARRFREEIARVAQSLQMNEEDWWRVK